MQEGIPLSSNMWITMKPYLHMWIMYMKNVDPGRRQEQVGLLPSGI